MNKIRENWNEIKEYIKIEYEVADVSYNTWILPLKFHDIIGDKLYILIPSDDSQALNYINKKYSKIFKVAISEMYNLSLDIHFILEKDKDLYEEEKSIDITNTENYKKANLNPKYKFETFVIGNNNKLAHSAALAVAESPGEIYNPLYIYGGAGLGKTHLMHSIGHFILESKNDTKVIYVTSEDFTNDIIENVRSGNQSEITKMRDKYRNADVLLVDDIQFMKNKNSTQEEFFNT